MNPLSGPTYLFDPFCGWCYAVSGSLERLEAEAGLAAELMPVGLFAGEGVRPLTAEFASYIWSADQRVAAMSGLPFGEAYRQNVLVPGTLLDSGPATRALTLVRREKPGLERAFLRRVQKGRWAEGRDMTSAEVLGELAAEFGFDPAQFAGLVAGDEALAAETAARIEAGQRLMNGLGLSGVPALLLPVGDQIQLIGTRELIGDFERVKQLLAA